MTFSDILINEKLAGISIYSSRYYIENETIIKKEFFINITQIKIKTY